MNRKYFWPAATSECYQLQAVPLKLYKFEHAQLNDTLVSSSAITVTCSRDQRFHQRLQAAETQLTTDV